MGHERWIRGQHDGQERFFDWLTPAEQQGIPEMVARALYERALEQADGAAPDHVQELYLALLADAWRDASHPSPGKDTRTMRIDAGRSARPHRRRARRASPSRSKPVTPGKRTLTSYIVQPARDARDQDQARARSVPLPAEPEVLATERVTETSSAGRRASGTRWDMAAVDRGLAASLGFLDTNQVFAGEPGEHTMDDAKLEQPASGAGDRDDDRDLDAPHPLAAVVSEPFMARMAHAFGQPFDHVRIVRDTHMPAGLQAFTRGPDIHLGPDSAAPDSPDGERILAHELAHVAQRDIPTTAWHSRAPSIAALENDAHQAALHALAGRAAAVHLAAPAGLALTYTDDPERVDDDARRGVPRGTPGGAAPDGEGADRAPAPAAHSARGAGAAQEPAAGQRGARRSAGAARAGARSGASRAGAKSTRADRRAGAKSRRANRLAGGKSRRVGRPAGAGGSGELIMREAPDTLSAPAQARLAAIDGNIQGAAERVNELPTADASTSAARGAVKEPQAEQDARAKAGVARDIDDRPPPSPEIEAACQRIRDVIRSKRPPDEKSLVDARPREMAAEAGGAMNAGIESRAGSVREGYTDLEKNPPGRPSREPVPVELPPEQVGIPEIGAASGVPDELPCKDVSLDADVSAQRRRIKEAGMTSETAELVQDGPIAEARTGLTDLESMAQADPEQVLSDQSAAIAQAAGDMQALQQAAEQALSQARHGTVGTLGTKSSEIKGSEEQQRAQAGQRMQDIFARARKDVDGLLRPLSSTALARWDAGVNQLATDFESSLASVKQRIEERYRTEDNGNPLDEIAAGLRWVGDQVIGLPDWVVQEYDRAEQRFADGCTALITDISRDVNAVIEDCQAIIQQARNDIDELVSSLPEELQAWARGEAARLGTELDALESKVTDTQQSLNQDLIERANTAVQEVRERVHELREAAKGLVGRIAGAIDEFMQDPARFIINGLLRVLGIPPANFWALVDQLGNVIDGIAADPMGFANNLMAGVGQGFQHYFDNFPLHIGQSLFAWLFSKMGKAGVAMPLDFSIPSIVSLVLDVMGINWQRVRMLLARQIGEQNVAHIDQAYDIIGTFIARGPLGLVELLCEQLDPASIVDMIRETAIRYLMESIITRVAARILMLLNPAGAILQAIEAIYRVLTWIYENAARIFTLIEAVVNGAAQVLAGNVGGMAAVVEHALVGLMVPVIDFLADYLGLGGIPEAVRDLVMGLQARIERILDRVIAFIAEKARALLRGKGMGGQPGQQADNDAEAAMRVVKPFTMDDESHTLTITHSRGHLYIQMASTPDKLMTKVRNHITLAEEYARNTSGDERNKQETILVDLKRFEQKFSDEVNRAKAQGKDEEIRQLAEDIVKELVELGRKHGIDDLGSLEKLEMPEHRHDRLIYEILVELKNELLAKRQAADTPEGNDDELVQKFHRAIAEAEGLYNRACHPQATEYGDNLFTFRDKRFFVDHQNNYIFPNEQVKHRHATLDQHVYATELTFLGNVQDLKNDGWRESLVSEFSYNKHLSMGAATLKSIAISIAIGQSWGVNGLTMFLAAMVAEPQRNSVAHVTNLIILGDTNIQQEVFVAMPMTTGGTDNSDAPRDPNLMGVDPDQRLPPAVVTDREVGLAKTYYRRSYGKPLPDAIDQELRDNEAQAKEWVKLALQEIMYQGW